MTESRETSEVAVVWTGTANVASVCACVRRLGLRAAVTRDAGVVRAASHVIVPGVGTMGAALAGLDAHGLVEVVRARALEGGAVLGVCAGHQLLGVGSEESPGVEGIGIHDAFGARFNGVEGIRVPQMGWNEVRCVSGEGATGGPRFLVEEGWAYFANSYRFDELGPGWHALVGEYGGRFVAALERGNVLSTQFHPELSGAFGARLLRRFFAATGAVFASDAHEGVAP